MQFYLAKSQYIGITWSGPQTKSWSRNIVLKKIIRVETSILNSLQSGESQKKLSPLAQTANQVLEIDAFFIKSLHMAALRPDARLLMLIMLHQSVSIKQAMLDSPLSYRAFYTMLDRWKANALIAVETDHADRRVRRLVAAAQFGKIIKKLPQFDLVS